MAELINQFSKIGIKIQTIFLYCSFLIQVDLNCWHHFHINLCITIVNHFFLLGKDLKSLITLRYME